MNIIVNGKKTPLNGQSTVLEFLTRKDLDPKGVVVELNRNIIPGEDYAQTRLDNGDKLEILRFVGGG